jgi:hypothetical protein
MQRAPPAQPIYRKNSYEEQGRLWPKQRAEANDQPPEKPTPNVAKHVALLSNEIELTSGGKKED